MSQSVPFVCTASSHRNKTEGTADSKPICLPRQLMITLLGCRTLTFASIMCINIQHERLFQVHLSFSSVIVPGLRSVSAPPKSDLA